MSRRKTPAELPGFGIGEVPWPFPGKHPQNVLTDHLAVMGWDIAAGSRKMWAEQHVIERAERMVTRQWLGGENVQGRPCNLAGS